MSGQRAGCRSRQSIHGRHPLRLPPAPQISRFHRGRDSHARRSASAPTPRSSPPSTPCSSARCPMPIPIASSWCGKTRTRPVPAEHAGAGQLHRLDAAESVVRRDRRARAAITPNLTGGGVPEQVIGRAVTPHFFTVLGVSPVAGRAFTEAEDRSNVAGRGHQLRPLAAAIRRRPRGHRLARS